MKIFLLAVAFIIGPLGVDVAHADSDGYYCVGPGYLAYQFGMAPLPVAPHRLHVLNTRAAPGIPEPAMLELPQFQVHGLRCGDGWIEVASFTAIYRVTLDDSKRPVRYETHQFDVGQKVPPEFRPTRNLGMGSPARARGKVERVSLGARDGGGQLFLEMAGYDVPADRCGVDLKSRVVETDRNGREVRERVLYQARGHRECGGGYSLALHWTTTPAPGCRLVYAGSTTSDATRVSVKSVAKRGDRVWGWGPPHHSERRARVAALFPRRRAGESTHTSRRPGAHRGLPDQAALLRTTAARALTTGIQPPLTDPFANTARRAV